MKNTWQKITTKKTWESPKRWKLWRFSCRIPQWVIVAGNCLAHWIWEYTWYMMGRNCALLDVCVIIFQVGWLLWSYEAFANSIFNMPNYHLWFGPATFQLQGGWQKTLLLTIFSHSDFPENEVNWSEIEGYNLQHIIGNTINETWNHTANEEPDSFS